MHNKSKSILWITMALTMLIMPKESVAFSHGGAWLPNSDDVFAIALGLHGYRVGVYDNGNIDTQRIALLEETLDSKTISFEKADERVRLMIEGNPDLGIDLGFTKHFGFFFWDGGEGYLLEYDVSPTGFDAYDLTLQTETGTQWIRVHDAFPIPVPASLWLLLSSLLCAALLHRNALRKE